jgi:hypothetical protein
MGDLGDKIHNGGPEDPRIGIIKVHVVTATYALNRSTLPGRVASVAKGVVTGNTAAPNKLRVISESEVQTCKSTVLNISSVSRS